MSVNQANHLQTKNTNNLTSNEQTKSTADQQDNLKLKNQSGAVNRLELNEKSFKKLIKNKELNKTNNKMNKQMNENKQFTNQTKIKNAEINSKKLNQPKKQHNEPDLVDNFNKNLDDDVKVMESDQINDLVSNEDNQLSIIQHDDNDDQLDFELISSNDDQDDSLYISSNLSSNLDSTTNTPLDSINEHQTSTKLLDSTMVKRNSQNFNQNFKEENSKSKESKLNKLFHHHKSNDQDHRNKQTWQKQLLQTPFFKSFNTQQLLSHYGKDQHQQALELPDKILNTDDSDSDEPLLSGSGSVSKECSDELIQLWSNILVKWKKPAQRPAGLKELIPHGIPQTLRGQVWQLLVEGEDDNAIIDTYRVLITKESAFEINIERDINRTFPANEYFRNSGSLGQDNLFKLCKAYSIFDEEIGYCQGLTFIGAALLLHLPEEQSFVVLVRIMHDYGVRNLFRSSFADLHLRFYQLDRLMEEQLPELYQHFYKLGVETHMFASQWMLTLFTAKFPLHLVFYILDLFLYNKFNTIFQVSIALLQLSQSELLKLDFEGVLKYFRVYLPKKYRTDANAKYLLKTAFNVKLKKLDKYEKDYAQYKELKEDPLKSLIKENQRLQNSVLRLEQENDQLATEISMSKLAMRAQLDVSEDKVDQLSNEIKRQNKYLNDLEDEKKLLQVQVNKLKEVCRRELESVESKADQNEKISNQYKEIVSKLSKRLEEQENIIKDFKNKISDCNKCSQLIEENNKEDHTSIESTSIQDKKAVCKNSNLSGNEEPHKSKQLESRIHELEIELAQTKLELVESKCNNQAIMHQLNLRNS